MVRVFVEGPHKDDGTIWIQMPGLKDRDDFPLYLNESIGADVLRPGTQSKPNGFVSVQINDGVKCHMSLFLLAGYTVVGGFGLCQVKLSNELPNMSTGVWKEGPNSFAFGYIDSTYLNSQN